MRLIALAALAGLLGVSQLAAPPCMASTEVSGKGNFQPGVYTLTYFSGPHHIKSNTNCITFVKTGNIAGFKNSGTWTSNADAVGNWIVDKGQLRWYGTSEGGAAAANFYDSVSELTGGFDIWFVGDPPQASADGINTLTQGCVKSLR
jgi:hypothetical protein